MSQWNWCDPTLASIEPVDAGPHASAGTAVDPPRTPPPGLLREWSAGCAGDARGVSASGIANAMLQAAKPYVY